jgi:PAS domain S-box-containing protein
MSQSTPVVASDGTMTPEERLAVSEQRLRLLADNAKDVVWSMSPQGDITYVSQAIEKLRGITPEVAMRQSLPEILTPGSAQEVVGYFGKLGEAAAQGKALPEFRGDLEYYRADGSTFWTEVFAFPLQSASGELVEILGVTRDISERKLHEERLMRAREIAERANASKSRFIAHVSHEIRTPMTTLLSWIQLAKNQTNDTVQHEALGKAQDAGRLLLGIINDLLDLSRMEHGNFLLAKEAFTVSDVASHVLELVEPLASEKGLRCSVRIHDNVPQRLLGDPLRLTQALLNLVSNAVKFTDRGTVSVEVSRANEADAPALLQFAVTDTGIGVAPEWQDKLFHDLVQVPDAQADRVAGTGLGLAICKRLAALMGGSVGVRSAPGQGSTFWFTARLAPADGSAARRASTASSADQRLAGRRILVVEDDASIRQAVVRLLEMKEAQVDQADNGAMAIQRLRSARYDLVMMDMLMPVMGGEECTRLIRGHLRLTELPVIGLTAAGFTEDRDRCIAAGMNDYLSKPFEFDHLLDVIDRHLSPSRAT